MWKWLGVILVVICLGLVPSVASADTSVDVTITATGYVVGAPTGLVITYISDTEIKLDWTKGDNAENTMVRAKYGEVPDSRTDGYQVYYGTAETATDTGANLDEVTVPIYYRLFSETDGGEWETTGISDFIEGGGMILIGLFIFAGILSYLAFRSSFKPMRFVAGFGWVAVLIYWIASPPSAITAGSAEHVAVILVLIFAAFAVSVSGFGVEENRLRGAGGESKSSSVFNLRKPSFLDSDKQSIARKNRAREEDNATYRDRVHRATHPRRTRR